MKYLVNRTTKEHRIAGKDWQDTDTDYWRVVQADSEGWLPHTGNVCPLPEDSRCEVRCVGCNPTDIIPAGGWLWNIPMTGTYRITHYRPILEAEKVEDHLSAAEWNKRVRDSTDKLLAEAGYQPDCSIRHGLAMLRLEAEPVQEPEPQTIGDLIRRDHPYKDRKQAEKVQEPDYDPRSVSFNLLDRLKAAHAQAQTIPDLEAELREVLGSMGYDLVKRSPFVEPEAAVETAQQSALPDKETLREIFTEYHESRYNPKSEHYRFEHFYKALLAHSRPAKGEK